MMNGQKELVAHLMRRAGFGATKQEIESLTSLEYEKIVDSLVYPSDRNSLPDDLIRRYHVDQNEMRLINSAVGKWVYKMVTTKAPLIEKMSLFWHGLFATGYSKVFHGQTMYSQIKMFRNHGMGSFSELLLKLSKDPAMLYWLDNHDNHATEINENYGRELLELFSMSIGNYTEDDVKECSRSFTGWTIQNAEYMGLRAQSASIWPYSQIAWQHEYISSDHDDGIKTFLGKTGNFNGEDIIEIICNHSATAEFISRRLYQFFVADEIDIDGETLIQEMVKSYFKSNCDISEVLKCMFNSDHLKIISLILSSRLYKNLKPVFKILLFDKENPKLGISSLVSFKTILGLYFLQISATFFTVIVSLVKLNISEEISSLSSMYLKHLATSTRGTKLLTCLPPAKSFMVPSWEAIFEKRFGIISIRAVSVE